MAMHGAFYIRRDQGVGGVWLSMALSGGLKRGSGGIRTHETVPRLAVFKTAAFNHSATLPDLGLRAPPRADEGGSLTRGGTQV